jgi:hypothetical protein
MKFGTKKKKKRIVILFRKSIERVTKFGAKILQDFKIYAGSVEKPSEEKVFNRKRISVRK